MATDRSLKSKALQHAAKDFVTLAHTYNPEKYITEKATKKKHVDIRGWLIYEKLDGVRARWHKGQLISRTKKPFPVPKSILTELRNYYGNMELDGELHCGVGGFQKVVSLVRNGATTEEQWDLEGVVYSIFDIDAKGDYLTRMKKFWEKDPVNHAWFVDYDFSSLRNTNVSVVIDKNSIPAALQRMQNQGKEGLILRNPRASYTAGRSHDLLKVKEFTDIEVVVVEHQPGTGKHQGRLGALVAEMPGQAGKRFKIGTGFSDECRESPPKVGSKVTIRYFELTNDGVPRFPVYVETRDYE